MHSIYYYIFLHGFFLHNFSSTVSSETEPETSLPIGMSLILVFILHNIKVNYLNVFLK